MRARAALAVLPLLLGGAANARAQAPAPDAAQLAYARPEGAGCVAESAFRALVAANLGGRDPFVENAPRRISVTLSRSPRGGFVGVAAEEDAAGKPLGKRESTGGNCARVTAGLGTVVAWWLFPIAPSKPPAPPPVARCAPAPETPPPAAPAPMCVPERVYVPVVVAPAPPPRPRLVAELGSLLSLATVPRRPGFGVVGAVGLRWPGVSLAVEARVDLPSDTAPVRTPAGLQYGSAWMASGTAAPCLHAGWFLGCALASGGVLRMEGAWKGGGAGTSLPYAALGLRAGIEVPLSERLALSASADLRASLIAHDLPLLNVVAWTLPTVEGAFGLRLVATFGGP